GNSPIGDLLPVEYIEKLASAAIGEVISEGTDIENNLSLFNRLMIKVQTPATSGNVYDYLNWALSVEGVGNALVKPLWNGNGTVKVLITNSENRAPTDELVKKVR
ncbi:baseplate J/gp47 family protein, partial [Clostridium neonatale]